MVVTELSLEGLKIIDLKPYPDERGVFVEMYRSSWLHKLDIPEEFVQDNLSVSKKGTLRGLHYQEAPHEQAKIVMVLEGAIYDVVVDIRKDSATFGQSFGIRLSTEKKRLLYIPKGFAHGFMALENKNTVLYKVSTEYHPQSERGILWNDPELGVHWPKMDDDLFISEKDSQHPRLEEVFKS